MSGAGVMGFGSGPFGGPVSGFAVLPTSTAASGSSVDLEFTEPYLVTIALLNPSSYSIDGGLKVLAVGFVSSTKIRLYTSPQIAGKSYQITVIGAVVNLSNQSLTSKVSTFVGLDPSDAKFVVSALKGETLCEGNSVKLTWTNPLFGVQNVKIVRKLRGWVFDPASDPGDVLYNGAAISEFTDTGLEDGQFYYYTVAISTSGVPTSYDVSDASRVMVLSVKPYDSSLFWKTTPGEYKRLDAKSKEDFGGAGFLEKWYTLFACWFTLQKGYIDALKRSTDDDQAPYPTIKARVFSMGLSPDGEDYDFDAARREALGLVHQYQIKGSCDGIVDMVRILTGWTSYCLDLSSADDCPSGALNLRLYDGVADIRTYLVDGAALSIGYRTLQGSGPWSLDEWAGSKVMTSLGDVACIEGNTAGEVGVSLSLYEAPTDQTTSAVISSGALYIPVVSASGFVPGMDVEVHNDSLGLFFIRPISSVDYSLNRLYFEVAYSGSDLPAGSVVSIGRSGVRSEVGGYRNGAISVSGGKTTLTDLDAKWETNQWSGLYYIDASNNTRYLIESNTLSTVTVVGAGPSASGAPVQYAIAQDFTVGASFALRKPWLYYRILRGLHTWLYNPVLDFEARNTRYDYYCRLFDPSFVSLFGAWGPGDVGVYITTPNIRSAEGKASGVLANVFTLDPTRPAPSVGSLAGYYLNPNENQDQLFKIVDNDATTVTVLGDITSLVVSGQKYFILTERNANRYRRIVSRLKKGFMEYDMRPHVIFI